MLSQPLIEFTPIRAHHKAGVNIAWVELHRNFAPLPFSCSTFSKSSFCHEQVVGQRHLCQCQCQCSRVHHTVIPARMLSIEKYAYQPLRYRVSDHHVSTSSHLTSLRLSHVYDPVAVSLLLNASVMPFSTRNLMISAYFMLTLSSSFHAFTV